MAIYNIIYNIIFAFKFTDYLLLTTFPFIVYVFQFYYKYFTRPNKLPGPLPLPFIECAYLFKSDNKQLYKSLQKKYGDIFEIYFSGRRIVISRPEYIKKMLISSYKDTTFLGRFPYSEGLDEFGMAGKGIIANHDPESWKFNRQFFNQAILSSSFNDEAIKWVNKLFKELEGYWKLLANSTSHNNNLQGNLKDNENNWSLEIDLSTWAHGFMCDMIIVLTTGDRSYSMAAYYNKISPVKVTRSDTLIEDSEKFIEGINTHVLGVTYFMFLSPFLRHHMPFIKDRIKSIAKNRDYLFERIDTIIKRRRKEIEETPIGTELRHDMLTSLIIANTERDVNNVKTFRDDLLRPMTDAEIRINLLDAFLGGIDTTTNVFCFLTYYVCHSPQVKQKMLAEIDSIFPPNVSLDLKHNDLLKLEYCEAIINETVRIMPVVNEFVRYSDRPCEIAGYQWDAGTIFHVNLNGIHSHKDYWSDPEIFDPDRFYKKDDSIKEMHKFALVLFGGGLRICPGRKLAMIELLSLMVLIFGNFDVELIDMKAPLKTKSGVATMCEELPIRVNPRIY